MLTNLINNIRTRLILEKYKTDWPRTILLIFLILAVTSALWQWAMPRVKVITQNQFHPVPVIKETTKIQRVAVACPAAGIITLDKAEVAKKLDIDFLQGGNIASSVGTTHASPASDSPVPGNPADLQVTATADLPESDNGFDMISLFDETIGETILTAKEHPAPWFQFRSDGAVGIKYGLCVGANHDSPYCGDIYGKWDFLRLKNLYISANGEIDTAAAAKLQLGAEYRW